MYNAEVARIKCTRVEGRVATLGTGHAARKVPELKCTQFLTPSCQFDILGQ